VIKYLLRTRRKSSGCCGRKRDSIKYRVVEVEDGKVTRISPARTDLFKLAKAEGTWQGHVDPNLIQDWLQTLQPREIPF